MRIKSIVLPTVAAAIVLVVALALGTSGATTSPTQASTVTSSAHVKVKVYMYAFQPAKLTVKVGTKITFTNYDQTAHTATALNQSFDTGTLNPGQSKTITFKKAGVFPYHCLFHEFMTGTIKVVS
jgi:plastocyanin